MAFGLGASRRWSQGVRRRCVRASVTVAVLALAVPMGIAQAASAQTTTAQSAKAGLGRPDVPDQRVSKVAAVKGLGAAQARAAVTRDAAANAASASKATAERGAAWPKPGRADVPLTAAGSRTAHAGGLPVTVDVPAAKSGGRAAAGSARVEVLDQQAAQRAGVTGVLLTAGAEEPGRAELRVDYSGFAGAIGGGWGQRLGLVTLPQCALTTPEKPECRVQTPVASHNDIGGHTVSAQVDLPRADSGLSTQLVGGAAVLALTAAASGSGESAAGTGDYAATPLSESSSWNAGSSSGSFSWSYDFGLPPAAAGPVPALSLGYDSGSVDGRTATSNNQGTSVGEGFDLSNSYVERSYGGCDDDGHDKVYDLCWKYDNATLVLNGRASKLVKDDTTGAWHLQGDDASKVTRSTGADNGDDDGEYWTVLTGDGTKYVFGLNKLPGAGTERTNSTWTVPVFGDDSGEPGYSSGSTFADRSLTQAWRWNLDYVEDIDGNAATYWYTKETNYYKKNKATKADAGYVRSGYLNKITYGLRKDALFTDDADGKVTFSYAERCTASDCSSLTKTTAENWPDVPFDAICAKDDDDCRAPAPSFFSRKRLTGISTFSWNQSTSAYDPVDTWAFVQEYLDGGDIGDSSDQVLTLKSIKRTGQAGTAITLNPVTFTYQMRPNRVDGTDDILPLTRPRISTVTSETGAITTVTLSAPECVRSQVLTAAEDTNTRNCYPQFWHINGALESSVDWFHKYRVLDVLVSDPAGQNEPVEYTYDYSGAAWHHNNEPMTPSDERTWSDWRGYRQVTVYSGSVVAERSKTVSIYLQGMNGDKKKDGTTRSVSFAPLTSPALSVASITDSDVYAGQLREQVTYDGSTAISASVYDPWSHETARQSVSGAPDVVAHFVGTARTTSYTYRSVPQTWRSRTVATTFDSYGMPVTVDDSGDNAVSGDETCARTWYARNDAVGLTSPVSRTRSVAKPCSTAEASLNLPANTDTRGDVLSDTAVVYDDSHATAWTANQTPTKGRTTWSGRATGYPAHADTSGERPPTGWQTSSTMGYDVLGRLTSTTDAAGNTTGATYTPLTSGPVTKLVTTDAKGFKTTDFIDPRRGLALRSYDANLQKTETQYDALGRLLSVWEPNRDSGAGQSPNLKFAYHLYNDKPSWISSAKLKADGTTYNTTYVIYDALQRPLQTQSATPLGGRLLTDTRYDSRGNSYETFADIFDSTTAPNGTYTRAEFGEAPSQMDTTFDGAGRETSSSLYVYGVKKYTTTSTYTGDSTATTALDGGTAKRSITDGLGRVVETRDYNGTSPADAQYGGGVGASYSSVKTEYGLDGKPSRVTGPDGSRWTYAYDLFGRQVSTGDPDKGTTVIGFNGLDQAISTTDSRGRTVLTAYDVLGRITGTWNGSKTDADQLTADTYDSVLKGQLTSAVRYIGGKNGKAYGKTVTAYDNMSNPVETQITLPADDPLVTAGSPATLTFSSYYGIDGTLKNTTEPALGGLPSETVDYGRNGFGAVTTVSGATGYLLATDYSALGQVNQLTLGMSASANKNTYITNTFEEGTGRQTRSLVTDQTQPYALQDLNYGFDKAGNVTSITDTSTLGGTESAETQCYGYDGQRRLTEAWTPLSQNCGTARSASALAGPAPYWTGYTYDTAGQRDTETEHKVTGDILTSYCYQGGQPHTLSGTRPGAGGCDTPATGYVYDSAGNTTQRPGDTGTQNLQWSPEGYLSRITESGRSTDYVYDAAGGLLVRSTSDGERILYAGATELHLRANGTTWAQRYYGNGTATLAVRTDESGSQQLYFLTGDQHGTSTVAVKSDTQAFVKRFQSPFGQTISAGSTGDWPDDKSFLGAPEDTGTGLTQIGARQYDPDTGQFISVDPVLDADHDQTMNGYSYAGNNPTTYSDPSGRQLEECATGKIKCVGGMPVTTGSQGAPCPSLNNPQCPEYRGGSGKGGGGGSSGGGSKGGGMCPSLINPNCPEYRGGGGGGVKAGACPSLTNPNCPEYNSAQGAGKHDNALKDVLSHWTSSTGCADEGFGGRVCAALNGILAGGGTMANAPPDLAKRWSAIISVFNNPNADAAELEEAIKGLANFLKTPAALKMASMVAGDKVQIQNARFGAELPGLTRYLKVANGIGLGLTAWSNYQATNGNVAETAVTTGADMGMIWASALIGAEIGTAIPVPIVGTAVGVTVGAVAGIITTSITNNAIDKVWHKWF